VSGLLEVEGVELALGGFPVLTGVTFSVEQGEILGIIGPNGAGKTSLLNCINGVYLPQVGDVRFDGAAITGMRPHRVAGLGIARTFQNLENMHTSTVMENVLLGLHVRRRSSIFADGFQASFGAERRDRRLVHETLEKIGLAGLENNQVGLLPYGKQKLVEVARAIVSRPKLLLLDEPVAGMNRDEKAEISAVLRALRDEGLTQVVIEHDVQFVSETCERLAFLHIGEIRAVGDPAEVLRMPEVVTAYIGTGAEPSSMGRGGSSGPGAEPQSSPQVNTP
jgi:branched-chain amino acid transport system ATP-binding protein